MAARRLLATLPVNIAQAVAGFGAIWAFTRLLSPDDYGRYALVLSATMLAHTLALTWAEAAAFRFLPEARKAGQDRNHFATLIALALIAALGAGVLAAIGLAFTSLNSEIGPCVLLAVVSTFLRFTARLARETDRADQRLAAFGLAESFYLLAGFALGAALAVTTSLGPAAPFAGAALAGLLVASVDARRLLKAAAGGRFEPQRARRYASYGAPLAAALACDLAVQTITRFFLAAHGGEASVGAYAASAALAGRTLEIIFVWASLSWGPSLLAAFTAKDTSATRAASRALAGMLLLLAAPAAVGLMLVAEPLSTAMVGEGLRHDVAALMPWCAGAAFFSGFAVYYFSEALQLGERTGVRAGAMLAAALVNVALCALLVPNLGAQGAAMANCGAALFAAAALALLGRRYVPLPLPAGDIIKSIGAVAAMTCAVLVVPAFGGWFEVLAKAAAGGAVYSLFAIALDTSGARGLASALWRRLSGKLSVPAVSAA